MLFLETATLAGTLTLSHRYSLLMYAVWGKVMSSVVSVILSIHMWCPHVTTQEPLQTCSLGIPLHPHGDSLSSSQAPRPVPTCSLCSPYIYRQAGGWPSTERPSCVVGIWFNPLHKEATSKQYNKEHTARVAWCKTKPYQMPFRWIS